MWRLWDARFRGLGWQKLIIGVSRHRSGLNKIMRLRCENEPKSLKQKVAEEGKLFLFSRISRLVICYCWCFWRACQILQFGSGIVMMKRNRLTHPQEFPDEARKLGARLLMNWNGMSFRCWATSCFVFTQVEKWQEVVSKQEFLFETKRKST